MEDKFFIFGANGYIDGCGTGIVGEEITEEEYIEILELINKAPKAPFGYQYCLREDDLEWELVKLPEVEIEEEPTEE